MSRFFIISLFILLLSADLVFAEAGVKDLSEFRWQNRIILVQNKHECPQLIKTLQDVQPDVLDRDILWFSICLGVLKTNYSDEIADDFIDNLRSDYFNTSDDAVILMGKDGGIKSRTDSLSTSEIFALIDSMPMRQNEMRRKLD